MSRLVFDIETSGYPFESLDPERQEYLLKFAETEEEREDAIKKINLYPYTALVACIGMLNVDSLKGEVLVNAPGMEPWESEDGAVQFVPGSEEEVIGKFWERVRQYEQLISFNGRGFDGPFLHIRSMMLGIRASRNLVPYRYDAKVHCDLLDQMMFYGATSRRFSLDFVCASLGIESPKRQGVTGLDVNDLFRAGKHREIAEYNLRDLYATRELFLRWEASMPE